MTVPAYPASLTSALRYGSVCTGIGAIDLGLDRAGMVPAFQCEIDRRKASILERHWPSVRRFHDLEELPHAPVSNIPAVDLLAGGTPCQDLSVAGRGEGLGGDRSRLFFDFVHLADRVDAPWVLWENVPGALSSNKGRDFAVCLEGFTGYRPGIPKGGWKSMGMCLGPIRWAVWRVLDGQWFGPPQRRRRVVVVAGRADTGPAPEVLFEPDCLQGHSEEGRAKGPNPPAPGVSGPESDRVVAGCFTKSWFLSDENSAQANHLIAVDLSQVTSKENRSNPRPGDPLPTFTARSHFALISDRWVRRLTMLEGERCFGLPDHWTSHTACCSPVADTPRGEWLGDSAIVPLFKWVGERIARAHHAQHYTEPTLTSGPVERWMLQP